MLRPCLLPACAATGWQTSWSAHSGSAFDCMPAWLCAPLQAVRITGYKSAALAAAAHDHVRLWQALQRAAQNAPEGAPRPSASQLVAQVEADVAALNFPVEAYTAEPALLIKLSACDQQKLEEHLQPHILEGWAPEEGGSSEEGYDAEDAEQPAGGNGVASAAALRRDNTTKFVGVSRVTGSNRLSAGITGESGAGVGCDWQAS